MDTISSSIVSSAATAAVVNDQLFYTPGSLPVPSGGLPSSAGAISHYLNDESTSNVQFMWQPLSDINYPSITLLASFKVSVFV